VITAIPSCLITRDTKPIKELKLKKFPEYLKVPQWTINRSLVTFVSFEVKVVEK
jgi:hypothetical protein